MSDRGVVAALTTRNLSESAEWQESGWTRQRLAWTVGLESHFINALSHLSCALKIIPLHRLYAQAHSICIGIRVQSTASYSNCSQNLESIYNRPEVKWLLPKDDTFLIYANSQSSPLQT